MSGAGWVGLGLAVGLALASSDTRAELRRVEAVGAVPAGAHAPSDVPVQEAALEAALGQAVTGIARELAGPGVDARVAAALGKRPADYVARYRLLEDRGERRPLLVQDPAVTREYVVVVEAHVDVDRIRAKLAEAGLLTRPGPPSRDAATRRLVLEGVRSYAAYAAVAERLRAQRAVRAVVPEEFAGGRVALRVTTGRGARDLVDALLADPPQGVELVPLGSQGGAEHLRVVERGRARSVGSAAPGGRRD